MTITAWLLAFLVLAAPLGAQVVDGIQDLAGLFRVGGLATDRDGDGFADGLRVTLRVAGGDARLAAAGAEIAGRLGLETCALDRSVLEEDEQNFRIIVAPGRGYDPEGRGQLIVQPGVLLVTGKLPEDVLAAARTLAALVPDLPGEGSLAELADDIRAHAGLGEGETLAVLFQDLMVARDGAWIDLGATLRPGPDRAAAVAAALKAGLEGGWQPGDAGLARLLIRVRQGASEAAVLEVPRAADLSLPPRDAAPPGGKARRFGLQDLFSLEGILTDSDGDLVPDGCAARIVPSGEAGSESAADVALRIGLETSGLRFPLTALPDELDAEKIPGPLILVGADQPLVRRLVESGRVPAALPAAGGGEILVINDAFGDQPAVVVRGGDEAGLRRAARLLLVRVPHLDARRVGVPGLGDLATEARRLVAGVSPLGQAARLPRESRIFAGNPDLRPGADVVAALEDLPEDAALRETLRRFLAPRLALPLAELVEADPRRPGGTRTLVDETLELPWEVDRARTAFREKVLPLATPDADLRVEVLVSEPRAIREQLADEFRAALRQATGRDAQVSVLAAYKPGFHWLMEVVVPAAKNRGVRHLEILAPPATRLSAAPWGTLDPRGRWFQELYPGLELAAGELGLVAGKTAVFGLRPEQGIDGEAGVPDITYEARVHYHGRSEPEILRLHLPLRLAPFTGLFPDYEKVHLNTGVVRAWVAGRPVVEELVETDLESIWTAYQASGLGPLRSWIMDETSGRPHDSRAPRFASVAVEASISEPEEELGIDLERISPGEALYEEFYFHTLFSTALLGQVYAGKPLDHPGRVLPDIEHRPGQAPTLRLRIETRTAAAPGLETRATLRQPTRRFFPRMKLEEPRVTGLQVRADGRLAPVLNFRCHAERDDRPAWIKRAAPAEVDSTVLSAAAGMEYVGEASLLRGLGIWRDTFVYPGVEAIAFAFETEDGTRVAEMHADAEAWSLARPPRAEVPLRAVPQTSAIAPEAAAEFLEAFAEAGGAAVHRVGRSWLGHDLWALETGPVGARHYARHKLAAWKPVLMISAREHANEVSSTNHVLTWLRAALNEPELLKHVTLVVNPVWNADGATRAMAQARKHPDWMLHDGYLGALGENLSVGMDEPDPVEPSSPMRKEMFATWLPDVFLNPHGYPTHEWVQPFSGSAAWVTGREPAARDWWAPRGFFLQHFTWPDKEEFKEQRRAAFAIRDRVVEGIAALPEVMELSQGQQRRYLRYGAFAPDVFRVPLVDGVLVNGPIVGSEPKKTSSLFSLRHPKTCAFDGIMEIPDETVHDSTLRRIIPAGLAFEKAAADHLLEGDTRLESETRRCRDGAVRKTSRKRPVLPAKE